MRFACLGSGSQGNALLIEAGATRVLLDCGFSMRETSLRLARLGLTPDQLTAIVVTHEHADHVGGVGRLARRFRLPVWLSHGTYAHLAGLDQLPEDCRLIHSHSAFALGDLWVEPFPVPHDAREPLQFVFGDGRNRLGILTDTGSVTAHIAQTLAGCDALVLECNHDEAMLREGPYPQHLKERVGGRFGHLSNAAAADLLARLDTRRLRHLVAAHLSEKNNRPHLARQALAQALGCAEAWVAVADQHEGLDWRELP